MSESRPKRSSVGAWITYEVANTVFWVGVIGLSFPLWLTKGAEDVPSGLAGDDAMLGYTLAATMATVVVLAPILGALSDQLGRRMPILVGTTLVSVGATLLLGSVGGLLVSLSLFALALCAMELGTIFYNSMLAEVSTQANRGLVSGLGQGIGYLGAIVAVGATLIFTESRGYVFVIHLVGILFLVFAMPLFLFLKERRRQVIPSSPMGRVVQAFSKLNGDLRSLHRFPGLRQFLIARFLYAMGINTAVAFAVIYASQTLGLGDREIQLILITGTAIAIPTAVLWGVVVDRIGPRAVLMIGLTIWIGLLLIAVAIPWLSLSTRVYWVVGCLVGVAMGSAWTADRPFMLSFIPHEHLGEFFGLHGMVGKLGRVVGPFMWAFLSSTLSLGQPAAIISLVGFLGISLLILRTLKSPVQSLSTGHVVQPEAGDGA